MTIAKIVVLACVLGLVIAGSTAFADTYTYDQYGRLTGVTYSDGSSVTYAYDAAGNRTTVSQTP
jgi:YD repeat-containing protein